MEKSKTKKSGNTPKMSRKSTKKPNKITKLFSKAFSSQKLSSEKDNKSDDDKVNVRIIFILCNPFNQSDYSLTVIYFIPISTDYSTKRPSTCKFR